MNENITPPTTAGDESTTSATPASSESGDEQSASTRQTVRIALDAMGGDHAPRAIVEGAMQAVSSLEGIEVTLVGEESVVRSHLDELGGDLSIRHAEQTIEMHESPSVALRKKKQSSIHVGIKMVNDGEVDAFISAGNTGAVMATATVILRTIEGIDRAAIAITLPTQEGRTALLDAGANVVCKASHLYQFGIMGSMYAQYVLGAEMPSVGLLSIGEENTKGNEVTREALEMLTRSSINFIGNTEAKLVYKGVADVVVCDGFTGNIALKISESVAEMIGASLKSMLSKNWRGKLAYWLLRSDLEEFKKRIDHSEVGGAPLLGIDGAVFISHGSSGPKSIRNALAGAQKFILHDVNGHIRQSMAQNKDIIAQKTARKDTVWSQMKRKIGLNSPDGSEKT